MKILALFSTLFSVVATAALLFVSDALFWHTLPLGFEGTLAYGARAMILGSVSALLGLVFAVIGLSKRGRTMPRIALCAWGAFLVLVFGCFMLT